MGDLWHLGQHLLLIGDCCNRQDIEQLTHAAGNKAHAAILDPPYGCIQAHWDTIANLEFAPFLKEICAEEATCIIFCTLPYGFQLNQSMLTAGWKFRFDHVWSKKNGSPRTSIKLPIRTHEHLFAYARPATKNSTLTFNGYDAGETAQPWQNRYGSWSNHTYHATHNKDRNGRADGKRWIRSVVPGRKKQELPKSERAKNPSQKPPELVERMIRLLSQPGQTIYDGFLGSGTTLTACIKTGRRCIAIERDRKEAEATIRGWEKMTGQRAYQENEQWEKILG